MKTKTNTKDTRPLAERITQGPYMQFQNNGPIRIGTLRGEQIATITDRLNDQREATANTAFISEAFTVCHETGRTPRQLADERAELIAALREAVEYIKAGCPEIEDTDETIATSTDDGPEAVFYYARAINLLKS